MGDADKLGSRKITLGDADKLGSRKVTLGDADKLGSRKVTKYSGFTNVWRSSTS